MSQADLDIDPNEKPLLSGAVKAKRTDVVLGGSFEKRYAALFSNRIEFWKSKGDAEVKPRGTPKDVVGLHLMRRLRYLDHAPGSTKADIVELYTHARTVFFYSDDDTTWISWIAALDKALRDSTFDFRDENEKERDLYPGQTPPPGAYIPVNREGSSSSTGTPRVADPLLNFIKRGNSMAERPTSANSSPRTGKRVVTTAATPTAGSTPSKTPRAVGESPRTPKSPKRTEERV